VTAARTAIQEFVAEETSGGVVLLVATVVGLVWVNVAGGSYHRVWDQVLSIGAGPVRVDEPLAGWVNDALMVLFFFVVGLEIKRELVVGELRDPRTAAMPVLAAAGGMLVPALIFASLNAGTAVSRAWGTPVATDIAFVVGVITLLGDRVPSGLKLFMLTLAIADDLGGILIIAIFYASDLSVGYLLGAVGVVLLVVVMRRLGIAAIWPYAAVAVVLWYLMYRSGVHATIAGVALGLLTPARPIRGRDVMRTLEHRLLPWSAFVVVPVFAVANAGIEISGRSLTDAFSSRIAWGVIVGLVVGKTIGITLFTLGGLRAGVGRLPEGVGRRHILGGGMLGGIGFTVALFVAELSLRTRGAEFLDDAKIGILVASVTAAIVGSCYLVLLARRERAATAADVS